MVPWSCMSPRHTELLQHPPPCLNLEEGFPHVPVCIALCTLLAVQPQSPSSEGRNKSRDISVSCANAEQMFQQGPEKIHTSGTDRGILFLFTLFSSLESAVMSLRAAPMAPCNVSAWDG